MKSSLSDIATPRLILRLLEADIINTLQEGNLRFAENFLNLKIPPEILDNLSSLQYTKKQLQQDPNYPPWSARAIILKDQPQLIGIIRFHSSPSLVDTGLYPKGSVEIGYRIFSSYRNMKYATEALSAIMKWAKSFYGIERFVASVAPGNIPSNRLIASMGFVKIAEVLDEIDGIEYVYLKNP